jgi:hypothetical protein
MFARVLLIASLAVAGCEKTDHDTIDKWTHTEKGADKLKKTLADESIDADLSAHAAANMIKKGADPEVRAAFETMSAPRRTEVVGKLSKRLWDIARVDSEDMLPSALQVSAKDALVNFRRYGSDDVKKQIDAYLLDWFCVKSYEARAQAGSGPTLGAAVVRAVGPAAGKKLISVVNGIIAAPGQEKAKNRIGEEVLLGLAVSSSPEAVKYVLDIARMDRGDHDLPKRAMTALHKAFVDPQGEFEAADPQALVPNFDGLVAIAKDDRMPGQAANDAIELIRLVGPPKCVQPLLAMIGYPHKDPVFQYSIPNNALRCGGVGAIRDVVRAIPDRPYPKDNVMGSFGQEIARMTPRAEVLKALRELLGDKAKMPRWIAIEALAMMKSVDDAPRIAALSGARDKLTGFWGDDEKGKEDPTLGQRAKELATQLGGK